MSNPDRLPARTAEPQRGFDVVLGNPPWDTMSPDTKEFFSRFEPRVRSSDKEQQEEILTSLLQSPDIADEWANHQRHLYAAVHFIKNSGRYRLFARGNLGKGDFNVYRMFVETAFDCTRTDGFAAQFVPENFYNGPNAAALRARLFDATSVHLLLGLINTNEVWFPEVHTAAKFCLYSARIGGGTNRFPTAFRVASLDGLSPTASNRLTMDVSLIRELSPDAMAVPELTSQAAVDVAVKAYSRWPKFGDTDKWTPPREYMREVDMGTDRGLFNDEGDGLPVYEGRMVSQFDHRAKAYMSGRGRSAEWVELSFEAGDKAVRPQWWIAESRLPEKVLLRVKRYRIGFCDVASPANERSLVAAMLPPGVVSGHSVPTIVLKGGSPWQDLLWVAAANSFAVDYLVRRKVSLHLSYSNLDSIPLPNPSRDAPMTRRCVSLAAALSCCGPEMAALWELLAVDGWVPHTWAPLTDERSRLEARAELDAIVATHFFGLNADDMAFVLEDFPTTAKYDMARWGSFLSRELILERMSQPPGFVVPASQSGPTQVQRGRAAAYVSLLANTWAKAVEREVLEYAMVFMFNDSLRARWIGNQPVHAVGSTASTVVGVTRHVSGLDQMLGAMAANGLIAIATRSGRQFIQAGPSAPPASVYPADDLVRAQEAIKAVAVLKDRRLRLEDVAPAREREFSVL
jgi:hypothetical protein